MGDASSEMSKVIAKAVAFFIYIVFSYIRVSDFRIPLYAWNLLTTDEKKYNNTKSIETVGFERGENL